MTQHKIHPSKIDSLIALTNALDMPRHTYIADNVEGYRRYWMRHDTGNEYNFLVATVYPSWDMVDSMPEDELGPGFMEKMGMTEEAAGTMMADMRPRFEWAYEDMEHIDQIWRPIVPDRTGMEDAVMGEEME